MKTRHLVVALGFIAGVGIAVAWMGGRFAGTPVVPLASWEGTSRTFAAPPSEIMSAISNAFDLFKYHDMMLTDSAGGNWRSPNWYPTNGLLLVPTTSTLGVIKTKSVFGKRRLPYVATFRMTLICRGTNKTTVNVRTTTSRVLDGLALGHGGIVANTVDVAPVRSEEENILGAIERQFEKK